MILNSNQINSNHFEVINFNESLQQTSLKQYCKYMFRTFNLLTNKATGRFLDN